MRHLALLLIVMVMMYGGPVPMYYTFVEHEGSTAYHARDISNMDRGDHHGRVCDNTLFYNAYEKIDVRGRNIKIVDRNGMRKGCGNKTFGRNGRAHKTCAYRGCGAWSRHPEHANIERYLVIVREVLLS